MTSGSIWKGDKERLQKEKKALVRQYLADNDISTKYKGYNILIFAILYAAEHPTAPCKELFAAYTNEEDAITKDAQIAYKTTAYAIKKVPKLKGMSVFPFIKDCSVTIES